VQRRRTERPAARNVMREAPAGAALGSRQQFSTTKAGTPMDNDIDLVGKWNAEIQAYIETDEGEKNQLPWTNGHERGPRVIHATFEVLEQQNGMVQIKATSKEHPEQAAVTLHGIVSKFGNAVHVVSLVGQTEWTLIDKDTIEHVFKFVRPGTECAMGVGVLKRAK
jgi:hypothetical protein